MANKKYYFALIELDGDKLNEWTGRDLVKAMTDLKTQADKAGSLDYFETNKISLERFRAKCKQEMKPHGSNPNT